MLFLRTHDKASDLDLWCCGSFWPGAYGGKPMPAGYPDHSSRIVVDGVRYCGCTRPLGPTGVCAEVHDDIADDAAYVRREDRA